MSPENQEMYERSFGRPANYFELGPQAQWAIDEGLGILDWDGVLMTDEERARYRAHYTRGPWSK